MKKNLRQTILEGAFELFFEKGYEETTIQDIIDKVGVARGSFYYHFRGKDELLNSVSELLDDYYEEIEETFPADMNCFEKLVYMNGEMHNYIEHNVPFDLIANLYSMQLVKKGGFNLLDRNRYYFILMNRLIEQGKEEGTIRTDRTTLEISRFYSMCERAIVTDWCMNNASYSLGDYSREVFHCMINEIRARD